MPSLIIVTFLLGAGFGVAGTYTYRDLFRRLADARLKASNDYLTAEVTRLRAQVALHIGKEPPSLYTFPNHRIVPRRAA